MGYSPLFDLFPVDSLPSKTPTTLEFLTPTITPPKNTMFTDTAFKVTLAAVLLVGTVMSTQCKRMRCTNTVDPNDRPSAPYYNQYCKNQAELAAGIIFKCQRFGEEGCSGYTTTEGGYCGAFCATRSIAESCNGNFRMFR